MGPEEKQKELTKNIARDKYYKKYFNISLDDYNKLLKKQKGKCAVCQKPASFYNKNLSVDHSHETGEVRGLLCFPCNHFIIGRHTDPTLLVNAGKYLSKKGTGFFVPPEYKKGRRRKRKKRTR